MGKYKSIWTGPQIDEGVGAARNPDTTPTTDSDALITSGAVFKAFEDAQSGSFTVTLAAASWSNGAQTVSNAGFIASGYAYIVSPASTSFSEYAASQIYADNVTTDGSMTFHCSDVPENNLIVNIVQVRVGV